MKICETDTPLEHDSEIPLYQQLEERLEKSIRDGFYREKEKIPSENKLCKIYDVSRITVRQALFLLEQKGLVYTVHGKGTFVKLPVISQRLMKIVCFSKVLEDQGLKGHTKVHAYYNDVEVDENTGRIMQTQQHGPLARLELVGYAQKLPIVYYNSLLRKELGASMYQYAWEMMEQGVPFSTYDLLHKAGVKIDKINQTIRARNAGKEVGDILKVPYETALIILETVLFDRDGMPVEFKTGHYRSDKFSFDLKREV
jgi:DNA-binding GntR family transcriptional regulator